MQFSLEKGISTYTTMGMDPRNAKWKKAEPNAHAFTMYPFIGNIRSRWIHRDKMPTGVCQGHSEEEKAGKSLWIKSLTSEWRKRFGIRQRWWLYDVVDTLNASEAFALRVLFFWRGTFSKSLLTLLHYGFWFRFVFSFSRESWGILAPWSRLHSLHWKAKSSPLDHHASPRLLISECFLFSHELQQIIF